MLFTEKTANLKPIYKQGINFVATIIAVFVGVGLIKALIECGLYSIPLGIKFAKNFVAFVVDVIPMIIGMVLGDKFIKNMKGLGD